jgi:glycosyltransferase involved in cell wall biosynthesis
LENNLHVRARIGVDVSCLSGEKTGIGRYTFEIISKLIDSPNTHWVLYSNGDFDGLNSLSRANVDIKILNFKFSRLIWGQLFLPILIARSSLNLFWSPTHRVPLFFPKRIPTVITVHDMVWKFAPTTMKFFSRVLDFIFMPIAVKRAVKIITVSESTSRDICEEYPAIFNKVISVHLGSTELIGEYQTNIPMIYELPNIKYILFVGTIEPRKNIVKLLNSFSLLPKEVSGDIQLIIAGSKGWRVDPLEDLCNNFNISNKVIILNYVTDWELSQLYKNALFLAIPSLYEGFGLPIVEAMKYGVPCLTSNISSMPEIAGKAAFLVNPNCVESIANGLSKLICDVDLLNGLRFEAKKRSSNFSWKLTAKKTMNIFLEVINFSK